MVWLDVAAAYRFDEQFTVSCSGARHAPMSTRGENVAEPVLTYRLRYIWPWVIVATAATIVVTGIYVWAWTQSLDRPWFPLLAAATVLAGVTFVVTKLKRRHTVEILSAPQRLRVRGLLSSETFDIAGATLTRCDVNVASTAHNVDAAMSNHLRKPPQRSELLVDTPGRLLVLQARGGRRPALAGFSTQLGTVLDSEVEEMVGPVTRTSAAHPGRDGRSTVHLDGVPSAQERVGRLVGWAVAGLAILGVPVALMGPGYESEIISSPKRAVYDLSRLLSAEGVQIQNDPEAVSVEADWRACRRENAWLWGEDDDVASLELIASTPVDPADMADVTRHLDEIMTPRGGELRREWRDPRSSLTISATDDEMEARLRHGCLREEHHGEAEAELSIRVASLLSWLAGS